MARELRCKGVIKNPKHPEQGRPCKRWAVRDSEFCAVHGGSEKKGWANPETLEHRCIARSNRTGSQCKKTAMRGMRVCRTHGGGNPGAQRNAQELLDRMVEPVLWELRDLALNPKTSDSDKLRAIQMVLDRSIPKERKIEVELKPWEVAMQHIFVNAPQDDRGMPQIPISTEVPDYLQDDIVAKYTPSIEDVVDAELVEEDPDPRDTARRKLPYIGPSEGTSTTTTVRIGSAEPPHRPGYRR